MPDLTINPKDYSSFYTIELSIGKRRIQISSKPGIAHWDQTTPSQELIVEHIHPKPGQKLLFYEYGNGAALFSVALAYPDNQFWGFDPNSIALKAARLTSSRTKSANIILFDRIDYLPKLESLLDFIVIDLGKGRELNRRWLLEGYQSLNNDGKIYVSGSNHNGIRSIADDLNALFNQLLVVDYKKGNRLVSASRKKAPNELPDWCRQPGIFPGTWKEISVNFQNNFYQLFTLPGVFSANHLDPGTLFLIENVAVRRGEIVLDFGCGWGPIGIWAALQGADQVDFLDNNLLAIACVKENGRKLHLTNTRIFQSDVLLDVLANRYDQIVSNPPFHTGHEVDYSITNAFIEQSYQVLNPKGKLTLVANQFIRYDRWLKNSFKTVECVANNRQFSIWQAIK